MRLITVSIVIPALVLSAGCGGGGDAPAAASNLAIIDSGPIGVLGNTLCLNADGPGGQDTYQRIETVLGIGAIESPSDAVYTPARPHIHELPGDTQVGPHFAFLAIDPTDVNLDLVPAASGGDRSRTEIKIAPGTGGAHDAFKAHDGDTYVYKWRFRIAPEMKFSTSFTHIHQIKAHGGAYSDPALITLTLSNGRLAVRHIGDQLADPSTFTTLGSMPLAGLPGKWIDVREEITYSNTSGHYRLAMLDASGATVFGVDKAGLQMWRAGATHMLPKWGIYRRHDPALNQNVDDYVYFANFAITHGGQPDSTCR